MSEDLELGKPLKDWEAQARATILTSSQAKNTLRFIGELLIKDGNLARGAGVLRCLEVLTGEPQPTNPVRNQVTPLRKPKPPAGHDA